MSFSALQRAEIAEISRRSIRRRAASSSFSALQRAEIAEMKWGYVHETVVQMRFSALQRAEIAEIFRRNSVLSADVWKELTVSVLFNEPKLLKLRQILPRYAPSSFSALQRAEIAEISREIRRNCLLTKFQCSSTSRNC